MKFFTNHGPLLRAAGVLSAIGVIISGVTFAALQSQQATLTGNSISSASADLRIGTSASTFSASRVGFAFTDIIPGGPAVPTDGNIFYLKNYNNTTLSLKLATAAAPTNSANVDLSKVFVQLTRVDTNTVQSISLQALANGSVLTDPLVGQATAQYKMRATMATDAFAGTGAAINGIDLVFSGTAVSI